MLGSVAYIRCPLLILQGTADMRVSIENARMLFQAAQCDKALEFIEGGDHNFTNPEQRQELCSVLVEWMKRKL